MGYLPYSITVGEPPKEETESAWVICVVEDPGCTNEFVHTSDGHPLRRYDLTVFATEQEARNEAKRLIDEGRNVRR